MAPKILHDVALPRSSASSDTKLSTVNYFLHFFFFLFLEDTTHILPSGHFTFDVFNKVQLLSLFAQFAVSNGALPRILTAIRWILLKTCFLKEQI